MSEPPSHQNIDANIHTDAIDSSNISLGNPHSLTQITDHSTHHHYYAPTPVEQSNRPPWWQRFVPSRHKTIAPWTNAEREILLQVMHLMLSHVDEAAQQRVYLELGLRTVPRLVAPVWRRHLGEPLTARPVVEPLVTMFRRSRGLLLVGGPGTGKSTFLRELCGTLLEHAQKHATQPVPVIVNLANYASSMPFVEWVSLQLDQIFSGQTPVFWQQALNNKRLLVLFDGLDEIRSEHRASCIAALNTFAAHHQTVVTSRIAEYTAVGSKLVFDTAIEIQPLTATEVIDTLQAMGEATAGLQAAIRQSPALQETLTTPLMLHVAATTYAGTAAADIRETAPTLLHQELWRAYLHRMLARPNHTAWPTQQMLHWLRWIAQMLRHENGTALYIEALQPRMAGKTLNIRVWWAVVAGIVCGLGGAVSGAILGAIAGGATSGLLGDGNWREGMQDWLTFGALVGLGFGLIVGIGMGLFGGMQRKIRAFKDRTWSWAEWRRSIGPVMRDYLRHGLVGGLSIGLCSGLITQLSRGIVVGLLSGLGIGMLVAVIGAGWTYSISQDTTKPNQSTWNFARSGVKQGLAFGFVFGAIFGLMGGLLYTPTFGMVTWWMGGFLGGAAFAIANGIGDFAKHFILRFILWRENCLPLRLIAFLEHGCTVLLLRRFGGAYQFYHLTLRDFLADCSDADLAELTAEVRAISAI